MEILKTLPQGFANCCITSPPYWRLRDYGLGEQIGQEDTPDEYITRMVEVFREVRRVLADEGTLWLNLGDTYMWWATVAECRIKPKDLIGFPWLVAFALRDDGWYLRQDIIWHKPNPMPESVKDRCTKAHEYVFLMTKSQKYYYDQESIKEVAVTKGRLRYADCPFQAPGQPPHKGLRKYVEYNGTRNRRSVWTIPTRPFIGGHFAVFPPNLIKPMVLAGCPPGGVVLDPFAGSGTSCEVARGLGRHFCGIELNPEYAEMAKKRITKTVPCLFTEGGF